MRSLDKNRDSHFLIRSVFLVSKGNLFYVYYIGLMSSLTVLLIEAQQIQSHIKPNFQSITKLCPFSQFNIPFPYLQRFPTEIYFELLFLQPKMLNKIKLSTDWGFIQFTHSKCVRPRIFWSYRVQSARILCTPVYILYTQEVNPFLRVSVLFGFK